MGTGLEKRVVTDSRVLINAEREGTVTYVDADKIVIKYDRTEDEILVSFDNELTTYNLIKFRRTNKVPAST